MKIEFQVSKWVSTQMFPSARLFCFYKISLEANKEGTIHLFDPCLCYSPLLSPFWDRCLGVAARTALVQGWYKSPPLTQVARPSLSNRERSNTFSSPNSDWWISEFLPPVQINHQSWILSLDISSPSSTFICFWCEVNRFSLFR